MIKAVIFDYGGVVKGGHNLKRDIGLIYGISEEEVKEMEEKTEPIFSELNKGLINEEEFWQKFSKTIGKPIPDNCIELSRKIYEETFLFFSEVIDLVKKLKTLGIKTAVLSNILNFQAEIIRKKDGYKEFDVVLLSYEEGLEKPDSDFYHLAIKRLNMKPEECIFVDDKEKNLLPAINLGMKTILAKNPQQTVEDVISMIESENNLKLRNFLI